MEYLAPRAGGVYVDATVGDGGHSRSILSCLGGDGFLIGIDRDEEALQRAGLNLKCFTGKYMLVNENFSNLRKVLNQSGYFSVDGVLLDLGVSSYQLEETSRGFSYREDMALDMRMDRKLTVTAADILKRSSREELAGILKEYGEERWASRIASLIVEYRKKQEIDSTGKLAKIIREAVPGGNRRKGHPAKRVFQALRIAVNREMEHLDGFLSGCCGFLNEGGRVCIISYHSLEDRRVKSFFREESRSCICPPEIPECICHKRPGLKILTPRPVRPSVPEVSANPRARSARLRAAEKISSNKRSR